MEKSTITIEFDAEGNVGISISPLPRMTYADIITTLAASSNSIIERLIDGEDSVKSAKALFLREFLDGEYDLIDEPEA